MTAGFPDETLEELLKLLQERLEEQDAEHNGGSKWVGTQGRTPGATAAGTPTASGSAARAATGRLWRWPGERKFRDFRKDNTLDTRQFQMAFRLLRQLSVQTESVDKELDVDSTIHDTCENAGSLQVRYKNPRKNTVKVLLLMDSGGSMEYYAGALQHALPGRTKSTTLRSCTPITSITAFFPASSRGPQLWRSGEVPTEWVLQNFDSSYKVIIVGDAAMNPTSCGKSSFSGARGPMRPQAWSGWSGLKSSIPI